MNFTGLDGIRPSARDSMLRCGVSALALCTLATAAPAYAQTQTNTSTTGAGETQGTTAEDQSVSQSTSPEPTPKDAIVVTGIRQSLRSAQQIKRNSDTVVDVITAQDIGALPDRSVTEALQRVPGVAINRFAGTSDPDHFSAEGSGVVVRGLTFVRSEFNGRDTFSTGVYGQAINFQDVPAELLGSVEVFKETTADRIEGGLSGTINMNLRLPFDNKGLHIGYDIEATFGDFRNKWSPVGSVLVSDNWDTGIGRIGLLGAVSYSKLFTRADGMQVSNFQTRDGIYAVQLNTASTPVCRSPLPASTDTTGTPTQVPGGIGDPCFGPATGGADGLADFAGLRFAPIGGQFRRQEFDRVRRGYAAAAQWQSLDRRALLTAQFLRSHASESWGEHVYQTGSDLSEYNTYPVGCQPNANAPGGNPAAVCPVGQFTNYQYDDEGVFQSGYITLPNGGWRGNAFANGGIVGDRVPGGGSQTTLNDRQVRERNIVQDQSVNFKFSPTPHWDINLDAQYVKAKHDNLDFEIVGSNFVDQELDLTGNYPSSTMHKPTTLGLFTTWGGLFGASPSLASQSDQEYFTDPRHTFWRSAMDHIEHSRGHEWAFKGDVAYNFLNDGSFLKQLKFGARYSDRQQDIKYTTYNWGNLSEVWGSPVFMDQIGVPDGRASLYTFNNFFRGQTTAPPQGWYYNGDLMKNYDQAVDFAQFIQNNGGNTGGWRPLAERSGVVAGTPFLPSEIQEVGQKTYDGYAMLRFGRDEPIFGNVRLDGNVGVRYVRDKLDSLGNIGVPAASNVGLAIVTNAGQQILVPFITNPSLIDPDTGLPVPGRCDPIVPPGAPPGTPAQSPGGICDIGATAYGQLQQFFGAGSNVADLARNKYNYWLPSANLKFGITNDLVFRLAASKDFARPSLADIRNFITTGLDANGNVTSTAGNPYLKPITSENFDATLEWYFAGSRLGSITIDGFIKNIHNYIYSSTIGRDVTSNGVTETIFVRGPKNFAGTGKVRGFEISYNQTYDFLPWLFSGLGLSANYAYVTSKGIPNSFLNGGTPANNAPIGVPGNLPLAQLSKHTFNIQPFYEKGPISIRVAYNWRSKFLLTEADVIQPYFPIWNDATGTLDASAFYSITPTMKIGVQAQNLTNEVVKTLQQFTLDGKLGPRSYFMNDRRFSFILRGSLGGSSARPAPPPVALPPPPPATQTCPDGSVVAVTATCPAPPPPPPPPPPPATAPERG